MSNVEIKEIKDEVIDEKAAPKKTIPKATILLGLARHFSNCMKERGTPLVWYNKEAYQFQKNHYQRIDELAILIRKFFIDIQKEVNAMEISEIILNIQAESPNINGGSGTWLSEHTNKKDDEPYTFPFLNGVIDVNKKIRYEHSPYYFTTYCLPYEYDLESLPQATPTYDKFLSDAFKESTDDNKTLLEEYLGYCLVNNAPDMQKVLFLRGVPGSGKSTLLELINDLVGRENTYSGKLSVLCSPFRMYDLLGKRMFLVSETKDVNKYNSAEIETQLYRLIANDPMDWDKKYGRSGSSKFDLKAVIAGNDDFRIFDDAGAWDRRLILINLNYSVPVASIDPNINAKLKSELPSIVKYAINGYIRLRKNGAFSDTHTLQDKNDTRRDSSDIFAFIEDMIQISTDIYPGRIGHTDITLEDIEINKISSTDLKNAYEIWLAKNNKKNVDNYWAAVSRKFKKIIPALKIKQARDNKGGRDYFYFGIGMSQAGSQMLREAHVQYISQF